MERHENSNVYILRLNKRRFMGWRERKRDFPYRLQPKNLMFLQKQHGLYPLEWGEVPKGTPVTTKFTIDGEEIERTYPQREDRPYIRFFNPSGEDKFHDVCQYFGKFMRSLDVERPGVDYTMTMNDGRYEFSFKNPRNSGSSWSVR